MFVVCICVFVFLPLYVPTMLTCGAEVGLYLCVFISICVCICILYLFTFISANSAHLYLCLYLCISVCTCLPLSVPRVKCLSELISSYLAHARVILIKFLYLCWFLYLFKGFLAVENVMMGKNEINVHIFTGCSGPPSSDGETRWCLENLDL